MTDWKKVFIVTSVLEVACIALLISKGIGEINASALAWYHVVSLSVMSWIFLRMFGHSQASFGVALVWNFLYWGGVFVIQVALTSPIIFLMFKFFRAFWSSEKQQHKM